MARPRDPEIDRRVLDAAREILEVDGYDALTIDAVAARAGVSAPSVYRRFRSPAHLSVEVQTQAAFPDPLPDTGSFAGDLRSLVEFLAAAMHTIDRQRFGAQVNAMIGDGDLARSYFEQRILPDAIAAAAIVERAQNRGEVDADLDGSLLVLDVSGVLVYRIMVLHIDPSPDELDELCRRVCRGVGA